MQAQEHQITHMYASRSPPRHPCWHFGEKVPPPTPIYLPPTPPHTPTRGSRRPSQRGVPSVAPLRSIPPSLNTIPPFYTFPCHPAQTVDTKRHQTSTSTSLKQLTDTNIRLDYLAASFSKTLHLPHLFTPNHKAAEMHLYDTPANCRWSCTAGEDTEGLLIALMNV